MILNNSQIQNLSKSVIGDAIKHRRHIHASPELSFKEYKTSEYIKYQLNKVGIKDIVNVANTGLLVAIEGSKPGHNIVLRAEMDALPIIESSKCSYRSNNKGVMHACGHDAHAAMLIALGKILFSLKGQLKGKVYLLFQPGEELAPGGASIILQEGILQQINPRTIIAQHVLPEMETGHIGFKSGKYMASSDEVFINIKGKGGHAALPGASSDQILIASKLVQHLKVAVESVAKHSKYAFGIGKFIADGATNVIPSNVHIEGTLRTFDQKLRIKLNKLLAEVCNSYSKNEIKVKLQIKKGYPVLINDPEHTEIAKKIAEHTIGKENVKALDLRMSSEDFAFYSQHFPIVFYRLGVKESTKGIRNLHTPEFDINENAMEVGIKTMLALTLGFLDNS